MRFVCSFLDQLYVIFKVYVYFQGGVYVEEVILDRVLFVMCVGFMVQLLLQRIGGEYFQCVSVEESCVLLGIFQRKNEGL